MNPLAALAISVWTILLLTIGFTAAWGLMAYSERNVAKFEQMPILGGQ